MVENIFIGVLCVLALGAGIWSLIISNNNSSEDKENDEK